MNINKLLLALSLMGYFTVVKTMEEEHWDMDSQTSQEDTTEANEKQRLQHLLEKKGNEIRSLLQQLLDEVKKKELRSALDALNDTYSIEIVSSDSTNIEKVKDNFLLDFDNVKTKIEQIIKSQPVNNKNEHPKFSDINKIQKQLNNLLNELSVLAQNNKISDDSAIMTQEVLTALANESIKTINSNKDYNLSELLKNLESEFNALTNQQEAGQSPQKTSAQKELDINQLKNKLQEHIYKLSLLQQENKIEKVTAEVVCAALTVIYKAGIETINSNNSYNVSEFIQKLQNEFDELTNHSTNDNANQYQQQSINNAQPVSTEHGSQPSAPMRKGKMRVQANKNSVRQKVKTNNQATQEPKQEPIINTPLQQLPEQENLVKQIPIETPPFPTFFTPQTNETEGNMIMGWGIRRIGIQEALMNKENQRSQNHIDEILPRVFLTEEEAKATFLSDKLRAVNNELERFAQDLKQQMTSVDAEYQLNNKKQRLMMQYKTDQLLHVSKTMEQFFEKTAFNSSADSVLIKQLRDYTDKLNTEINAGNYQMDVVDLLERKKATLLQKEQKFKALTNSLSHYLKLPISIDDLKDIEKLIAKQQEGILSDNYSNEIEIITKRTLIETFVQEKATIINRFVEAIDQIVAKYDEMGDKDAKDNITTFKEYCIDQIKKVSLKDVEYLNGLTMSLQMQYDAHLSDVEELYEQYKKDREPFRIAAAYFNVSNKDFNDLYKISKKTAAGIKKRRERAAELFNDEYKKRRKILHPDGNPEIRAIKEKIVQKEKERLIPGAGIGKLEAEIAQLQQQLKAEQDAISEFFKIFMNHYDLLKQEFKFD